MEDQVKKEKMDAGEEEVEEEKEVEEEEVEEKEVEEEEARDEEVEEMEEGERAERSRVKVIDRCRAERNLKKSWMWKWLNALKVE